jgi:hypothetical protein
MQHSVHFPEYMQRFYFSRIFNTSPEFGFAAAAARYPPFGATLPTEYIRRQVGGRYVFNLFRVMSLGILQFRSGVDNLYSYIYASVPRHQMGRPPPDHLLLSNKTSCTHINIYFPIKSECDATQTRLYAELQETLFEVNRPFGLIVFCPGKKLD